MTTFNFRRPAVQRVLVLLALVSSGIVSDLATAQAPAERIARRQQQAPPAADGKAPFPPLPAAAQAKLQNTLTKWEQQTSATKTLETKFSRWHYDPAGAPSNIHSRKSDGIIKYARPDKGLIRVDRLVYYIGMQDGQPQYKEQPGQFGEHWVCNGKQLIEFDRSAKECKIQDLPADMQGEQIISSPLPFIFNLDAAEIQRRYWVRQVAYDDPQVILIEAWPRRQEDRSQYKLVQIALNAENYLPQALIMYAPNFDAKTAPTWDHYQFTDVKRNTIGAGLAVFVKNFIPQKPPSDWKVTRQEFPMP